MATLASSRITNYSISGSSTPSQNVAPGVTCYCDIRGQFKVYYQLNSAKTSYTITVEYYANYYDYLNDTLGYEFNINSTSISAKYKVNDNTSYTNLGSFSKTLTASSSSTSMKTYKYGTKTFSVPVRTDGTAEFSFSGTITAKNIDYQYDDTISTKGTARSCSFSFTLPKVNTSSSITSNATSSANKKFGEEITFTMTRLNTSVTHTLTYKIGDTTYTIGSGIATSKTYTFPESLISSFPNNAKPSIVVNCASSNGTSCSTTVYLTVPDSYVPTFTYTIEEGYPAPVGLDSWVQNQSKMVVTITGEGVAGSTIKNYSTKVNGSTYTTNSFTTSELKNSGTQSISITVTDSRGRQASQEISYEVIPYHIPTLSSYEIIRCLEDGTNDNEGTFGKIKFTYSIAPLEKSGSNYNEKQIMVQNSETAYIFNDEYGNLPEYSGTIEMTTDLFSGLSTASKHEFTFYISDYYNNKIPYTFIMSPSFTTVSKLAGGKGVSIGQVATEEGFHSHMDTYFHNKVYKKNETTGEFEELGSGGGSSGGSSVSLEAVYPVGSLYFNASNDTNPYDLFGFGEWQRVAQGKVLIGLNENNANWFGVPGDDSNNVNQGSWQHTHTVPGVAHTHDFYNTAGNPTAYAKIYFGSASIIAKDFNSANWTGNAKKTVSGTSSSSTITGEYGVELGGATDTTTPGTATSSSTTVVPPFFVVYIWQRIK